MTERTPMTEQEAVIQSRDGHVFRAMVGIVCLLGSFVGLFGLYFVEVPPGNREPLLLALGIVLGWTSAVVQSEYGASNTARKVTEGAIRKLNEATQEVTVTNSPSEPVPTTEAL